MTGYATDNFALIKVKDHSAAGTSPITSLSVDMETAGVVAGGPWDGVVFFTSLSVANAGNYMTMGHSDADSAYAPTVAVVNSGTSDEDLILDVQHPAKRWVNVIVTVGTSSTVESIWALLYRGRTAPVTSTLSGTAIEKQFNAPATA